MNPHPLHEFGGSGPVMHLAVSNGFPPEIFAPLLEPFTSTYRVTHTLPRPLWPEPPDPAAMTSWRDLAADMLDTLRAHDLRDIVAVGHSMGGVMSTLAVIAEPERFRALILLDPTFLPPSYLVSIRLSRVLGMEEKTPIMKGANHRRDRFPDAQAAFDHWRKRRFFADWSDEALWNYVSGGLRPAPDGDGLTLRWSREWEARCFQTIPIDAWREARKLKGLLPLLIIRGEKTNTFLPASERKMRRLVPDATYVTIKGHGHLFPQSAPAQAAPIMADWLASL